MPLVHWVGDRREKVRVAPRAPDVFGRAAALARKEARVGRIGRGLGDRLDLDGVAPIVAEVIDVGEDPANYLVDLQQLLEDSIIAHPFFQVLSNSEGREIPENMLLAKETMKRKLRLSK